MKKLVLTLGLILFGVSVSKSAVLLNMGTELSVGSNPVGIVENPIDGVINVFCAGIDANGNNVFDENEDEKPSWWQYNPNGSSIEPVLFKEFDNFFVSPFKPTTDTLNGYSLVVVPFAATKVDGQYTTNGFVQGFQMKSGAPAFKTEVENGEYLTLKREVDLATWIVRTNGNDSLVTQAGTTEVTKSFELNGNASDFAFVDLDFDGNTEIAILVDNKSMNFIQFRDVFVFEPIKEIPLDQNSFYTGSLGHLYSKGSQVYTTFPESNALVIVRVVENDENEVVASVYKDEGVIDIENIQSYYPLSDEHSIISNENYNVLVTGYTGIPEMHRTNTGTDIVYANSTNVYVSGKNKVFTYLIENELNIDKNQISRVFTGFQPMEIHKYDDYYLNLNLGVDFNYDGNFDEASGDQKPSIGRFYVNQENKIETDPIGKFEFDFPINFPVKSNISSDGNITIASGNKLYYYNVEDRLIIDSLISNNYVTCSFSVLDYLVVGERDFATNKSYIRIIKDPFIDVSTEVGANVVDCIVYQNSTGFGVVSLSEGNFGEPDSKINIIKLSTMGVSDNTSIDVGTGGNSIVINKDQTKAAIVMTGSHEVHILNLLTGQIDLTFSTETSGFFGPRDAAFHNNKLYVTTYNKSILVFDINTGNKLASIIVDGHTEGIVVEENYIIAANSNYSNYAPNNRIMTFSHPTITSVENNSPNEQAIRVYPHPASTDFNIVSDDIAGDYELAIINSQGKIVATHSGSSNGAIALNTDELGLTAGNYTAIINGTRAVRFVVIK